MSFQAGSITAMMGIDTDPYARGMLKAESIARLFPATVQNFLANPLLGLVGVAQSAAAGVSSAIRAIIDNVKEVGQRADDMGELAEKVGVSVEFLSQIGPAAANAGSSIEGLAQFMKFLGDNTAEAARGNKTAQATFADLGVAIIDQQGKLRTNEQIFFDVADAISRVTDQQEKLRLAGNIGSKAGNELLPTLNQGRAALEAYAARVVKFGADVDRPLADAGDSFGTLMSIVDQAVTGIKRRTAEPILQYLHTHFDDTVKGIESTSSILQGVIGATFAAIREELNIPPATKLLDNLGNVAEWVKTNPDTIKAKVGSAIEWLVGKANALSSALGFVIRHSEAFAYVLGAGVLFSALGSAVGMVNSLGTAYGLLTGRIVATSAAAKAASLVPAGGLAGLAGGAMVVGGAWLANNAASELMNIPDYDKRAEAAQGVVAGFGNWRNQDRGELDELAKQATAFGEAGQAAADAATDRLTPYSRELQRTIGIVQHLRYETMATPAGLSAIEEAQKQLALYRRELDAAKIDLTNFLTAQRAGSASPATRPMTPAVVAPTTTPVAVQPIVPTPPPAPAQLPQMPIIRPTTLPDFRGALRERDTLDETAAAMQRYVGGIVSAATERAARYGELGAQAIDDQGPLLRGSRRAADETARPLAGMRERDAIDDDPTAFIDAVEARKNALRTYGYAGQIAAGHLNDFADQQERIAAGRWQSLAANASLLPKVLAPAMPALAAPFVAPMVNALGNERKTNDGGGSDGVGPMVRSVAAGLFDAALSPVRTLVTAAIAAARSSTATSTVAASVPAPAVGVDASAVERVLNPVRALVTAAIDASRRPSTSSVPPVTTSAAAPAQAQDASTAERAMNPIRSLVTAVIAAAAGRASGASVGPQGTSMGQSSNGESGSVARGLFELLINPVRSLVTSATNASKQLDALPAPIRDVVSRLNEMTAALTDTIAAQASNRAGAATSTTTQPAAGPLTVNTGPVQIPFDAGMASSQVASFLRPMFDQAKAAFQRELASVAVQTATRRGM